VAIDGGFIREPQRRVWIENQRKLDLATRLFNEGRYTILEFLTSTRHVTPTFGVSRPQIVHNTTTANTEPPANPVNSTNQHTEPVDHQNNHLALQARAREWLVQRRVNGAEITS